MYRVLLYSILGGYFYFEHMIETIPKDSNCSFCASIYTDILAFIVGAYLTYVGVTTKHELLQIMGIAMVVEHALQVVYNKKIDRQEFKEIDRNILMIVVLGLIYNLL